MRRSALIVVIFLTLVSHGTRARTTVLTVCESGCTYTNTDLQAALLDALPGDDILLQAGHTYLGTFKLPAAKDCPSDDASCYISVTTGVAADGSLLPDSSFPPHDLRVAPADAANLARLQSNTANLPAIRTVQPGEVGSLCAGAPCVTRWWRFARLEIAPEATYQGGALIELGSNNMAADSPNGDTQDLRSEIPSHFILEQIYAHGDPARGQFRGLYLHADDVTLKDSYVSDIKSRNEGQAITITNCAGPIAIVNNYLEGNGENVLSGGDGARAMQTGDVLASPAPTSRSARLSATTDLQVGQWISVLAGGVKQSTIVRSISSTDITFDPIAAAADVPGAVRWAVVPGNLTFARNHVYKPPSWRDPIVESPSSVSASPVAGSGSLPAGTYGYRIVARRRTAQNTQSYSAATAEVTVSLQTTGTISVSWASVPDVQAYIVYGRTPGGANQSWTVSSPATSFTDTGAAGTTASIPSPSYWLVKNSFELKAMDGALIEGNVFDYSWKAGQMGYVVLFTVANTGGANDSTVVRDLVFRHNRVRHGAGALQMTAQDVAGCACQVSGRLENVTVENNLFEDIGTAWGSGIPAIALSGPGMATQPRLGPANLTFNHNTLVTSGTNKFLNITLGQNGIDYTVDGFTFINNMTRRSTYGLRYDKSPGGMQAEGLTSWTLGTSGTSTFARNVIADANCSIYPDPAQNFCPASADWQSQFVDYASGDLRLRAGSPYEAAGTDGNDLGADVSAVDALTRIALSGDNRSTVDSPPPPALVVTTTSTPDGEVGAAYSTQISASGGVPPYAWTPSGQQPPGLMLSSGGELSGTPTSAGTFTWTATVTDSTGTSVSSALSTFIASAPSPPLVVTTTATPDATVGVAYSSQLGATGGVPPYTWTNSGQLPAGLVLSPDGLLSGTPTAAGTFSWTANVSDSRGTTASGVVSTIIASAPVPPLTITTTATPDGMVGASYSAQVEATGGVAPYSWSSTGQLPAGLAFSASGMLSGIPSSSGTFSWVAVAADSAGTTASAALTTIIVAAPPPAAPTALVVTSATRNQVRLAWTDNSNNETSFRIQRSADGVNFKDDGTVAAGVTTFTSTGLRSGRTYYFRVLALGSSGGSAYSNIVSATTLTR